MTGLPRAVLLAGVCDVLAAVSRLDLLTMAENLAVVAKRCSTSSTPTDCSLPCTEVDAVVIPTGIELVDAVVIIGSEDWSAGYVTIRDLTTGDQQRITVGATPLAVGEPLARRR